MSNDNPATTWLGTTWQKQESRFLLGSSSSYGLGTTGGASTVKLAVTNLPSHTHSATTAAHTHTQPTHQHIFDGYQLGVSNPIGVFGYRDYVTGSEKLSTIDGAYTSTAGGDTTGSASPVTSIGSTGSGAAFSIMPPYLTVNIWKRLS